MSHSAHTLFISDLHLSADRPDIAQQFLSFIQKSAPNAEALYILGDLFEIWLGDDAISPAHGAIIKAIRHISDRGIPVYFMHGNRDFLIGNDFATACGCKILNDPCVIDLYGTPTLLTHGDILCTDDTEYQKFRAYIRNPQVLKQLMSLSIEERIAKGKEYRMASQEANKEKSMAIMDVNQDAVKAMLREHGVEHMIHGHTHRPNVHTIDLNGKPAQRIVLGDWYEQGSQLYCDASGCELQGLAR
ncbi:MAG: UDP-2,3-diacylglucosamine diphosphatase [Gammaproteobacteria bacterium]|nr:UDP-2,3-diacylglucosamine diphosphatase [bacterium AH-315-E07]PCH61070.1 MAG: UDP-2,3-diacylglucosamine diphosphatase [Gammaproteobacteria bacterium]